MSSISTEATILGCLLTHYHDFGQLVTPVYSTATMESFMNFKNFGDTSQQTCSNLLARQSSVFSLTFDELQNSLGGGGASKDFGSMNMEDLLKSIWTAEEGQALQSSAVPDGNLQRQGSLTLPRTLSQKTVDEVWKDVLKETVGTKDGVSNLGTREPTLGEVTLEEFLFKAGVVKEDVQPSARTNTTEMYNLPPTTGSNSGLTTGFQQSSQSHTVFGNQLAENKNMVLNSPNLGINMNGVRSISNQKQVPPPQQQFQPLFPKQTTVTFSSPSQQGNNAQLSNSVTKGPMTGIVNAMNNTVQGGGMVMGGLCNGASAAVGSPVNHLHVDAVAKSSTDTASLSPSPYNFGEGGRGRKAAGSFEKAVERRRKRMIKNRESAARSRARKQAYTLELEAEVAKLKEMNEELRKKQEEFMKTQKNEIMEMLYKPHGGQRRSLRRTLTGPL